MRQLFLTGGTGTIGSALVPQLLSDGDTRLTLLIRAASSADLEQRLARMHTYWGWPPGAGAAARIDAVRGDITQPNFGLQQQQWDHLASTTTHIVHCAAALNLLLPLDQARAAAVVPTRTVLALARQASDAGVLRKVDLVSTVGVWGRNAGAMPETPLPHVSNFHNTYEAAKAEAERVVWNQGAGLPVTVHRPSMVVGETGTGRVIHFQVFYHLCEFLSGARTFGVMPPLGPTRLDTVPVDWVARVIDWASHHEDTAGRIFHLCSGTQQAMPLTRLRDEVRRVWQAHGRALPRLRQIDTQLLRRLIPVVGLFAGRKGRRALRALPPVLDYLAEDQSFSNTQTLQVLNAAGLPLPAIGSYLDAVLAFYLQKAAVGRPGT